MEKNITKVETTQKSQTAKNNIPTGKVTTKEQKEARRKAREKEYKNFRIAALKRRCKRMKISDEETSKLVEKLLAQLDAPKQYRILVLFKASDHDMFMEGLANANIKRLMQSNTHVFVDGDQNVLAKIREIAPVGAKIHPYAKKQPPVLETKTPPKVKKKRMTKQEKKNKAKAAKAARKAIKLMKFAARKKNTGKSLAKIKKRNLLLTAKKAKNVKLSTRLNKKLSEGSKKPSKTIKQAA